MDVLSDVLRAVRFTGVIFFERNAQAPWVGVSPDSTAIAGKVMPQAQHVINFHALVSGTCWVALVDGSEPGVQLNAGDIIILPTGDAHVLSSAPGMRGGDPDLELYTRPCDRQLPIVTHYNGGGRESCHIDLRLFRLRRAAVQSVAGSPAAHVSHSDVGGRTKLAV